MMTTSINIISATDDNYAQHYGVMLCSLFENKEPTTNIEVYLIDGGLSLENKEKLIVIARKYKFTIKFLTVNRNLFNRCRVDGHINESTYYRIFIPDIVPTSIDKIIYLDCDTIVLEDLSNLWSIDISDFAIGAVPDIQNPSHKINLGMSEDSTYFNAGLLLININMWRRLNISHKVMDFINNSKEKINNWDQDGLNATLFDKCFILHRKYNTMIFLLSNNINNPSVRPNIYHYIGSLKPWHMSPKNTLSKFYYTYLSKSPWKGFTPHKRIIKNITEKLKYRMYNLKIRD